MGGSQSRPEHAYVSRWYLYNEMEQFFADVRPGDAIEFYRSSSSGFNLYNHWGIYVGKVPVDYIQTHCVIHASSPANANSANVIATSASFQKQANSLGVVVLQSVVDAAHGSSLRINNSMDKQSSPNSQGEIVRRAFAALREYDEYNVLSNNCEHFVKWCRNGVKLSSQVDEFFAQGILFSILGFSFAIGAAGIVGPATLLVYFMNRGKWSTINPPLPK